MMRNLQKILLIAPFFFLSSCERIKHGCLDSSATNYTDNANIDNNSCCYNCYYTDYSGEEILLDNYCGNDVEEIESSGYSDYGQVYVDGIPQFNASGEPLMQWINYSVDCR